MWTSAEYLSGQWEEEKKEEKLTFNILKLHVFRKITSWFWRLYFLTKQALEINKVQFQETSKWKKKFWNEILRNQLGHFSMDFFFLQIEIDWIEIELQGGILNNAADRAQHKVHSVHCASWHACITSMDRQIKQWFFSSRSDFLHPSGLPCRPVHMLFIKIVHPYGIDKIKEIGLYLIFMWFHVLKIFRLHNIRDLFTGCRHFW